MRGLEPLVPTFDWDNFIVVYGLIDAPSEKKNITTKVRTYSPASIAKKGKYQINQININNQIKLKQRLRKIF